MMRMRKMRRMVERMDLALVVIFDDVAEVMVTVVTLVAFVRPGHGCGD